MSKIASSEVPQGTSEIDNASDIVPDVLPDERIAYVREKLEIDSQEEPPSVTYVKNNMQVAAGAAVVLALVFLVIFKVLGIVVYGAIIVGAFAMTSKGTIISRKVITECLTDRAFYFQDEESGGLYRTQLEAISKIAYAGTQLDALTPHGRVSIVFDEEHYAEAWHTFIRSRGKTMIQTRGQRQRAPTVQRVQPTIRKVVEPTRAPPATGDLVGDLLDAAAAPVKTAAPPVVDSEDPFGDVLDAEEADNASTPAPVAPATKPEPAPRPAVTTPAPTDPGKRKVTPEYARAVIPKVKAKIEKLDDLLLEEKINEAQYDQQHEKYSKMLAKLESIAARGP